MTIAITKIDSEINSITFKEANARFYHIKKIFKINKKIHKQTKCSNINANVTLLSLYLFSLTNGVRHEVLAVWFTGRKCFI